MRLSIYLLNKTSTQVPTINTFVLPGTKKSLVLKPTRGSNSHQKALLFYKEDPYKHEWINAINPLLVKPLEQTEGTTIRAVLIIQVNRRYFALSFNNGISLVKSDYIDYDFGFGIAKKRLDEKKISSYYSTDFTEQIINTKSDSSTFIPTYIINNPAKLSTVSSLSGKDSTSKKRIVGKYNLVVDFDGDLKSDLVPYLKMLSNLYFDPKDSGIKLSNGLTRIKNNQEVEDLNERLFLTIKKWCDEVAENSTISFGSLKKVAFNINHEINEDKFSSYVIEGLNPPRGQRGVSFEDLNIHDYFDRFCNQIKSKDLTIDYVIDKLKRDSIWIVYEEEEIKAGNIYNSLVFTCSSETKGYKSILIAGKWYLILENYYLELERKINVYLGVYTDIKLDGFSKADKKKVKGKYQFSEEVYNNRMAKNHSLFVLDQKFYYYPDEIKKLKFKKESKIEPCDLLKYDPVEKKLVMWHVKRGTGAQGISHLATQAESSAAILADQDQRPHFIEFINQHITSPGIPTDIKKEDITIVLGLTKKNPSKESRDIFSLLELKALEKVLTGIAAKGFGVSLNLIKDNANK